MSIKLNNYILNCILLTFGTDQFEINLIKKDR